MALPLIFDWRQAVTKWKSLIDPILDQPSITPNILKDVKLKVGTNVINHELGIKLTGWRIIRINAAATIYDLQSANQTPQLTLVLSSSAVATVSLEVF
jgi:hypothetical protein